MKIVDRKTFLAMPAGTVFSKYEPCVFGDLLIKGDSCGQNDFWLQTIADAVDCNDVGEMVQLCIDSEETGASMPIAFDCESRDGLFDDGQLFAVWERKDVEALIARLAKTLEGK